MLYEKPPKKVSKMCPLFNIPKHEEYDMSTRTNVLNQCTNQQCQAPLSNERKQSKAPPQQQQTKNKQDGSKKFESININSSQKECVCLMHDCLTIKFLAERNNGGSEKQRRGPSPHEPNQKYSDNVKGNDQHFLRTYGTESPPLDGVTLFKAFISSNNKCYWNATLCEAISSLEYKGYVHPSTVLVCTTNCHMNVLRDAWSRRILRDPPGFTTDFLGEIEELVAKQVEQVQHAPLYDSLCWAIAELNETGQEAFVDSIRVKLSKSIITQPPRELIFQTLEKLIREHKIYQTFHGYHIVNSDITTSINYSMSVTRAAARVYGRMPSDCFDKWNTSRYSTRTVSSRDPAAGILPNTPNKVHLQRQYSHKIVRSKLNNYHEHPSIIARTLSFRRPKGKSLSESEKGTVGNGDLLAPNNHPLTSPPTLIEKDISKENPCILTHQNKKKRQSFFTRVFTFRGISHRQNPFVLDNTENE